MTQISRIAQTYFQDPKSRGFRAALGTPRNQYRFLCNPPDKGVFPPSQADPYSSKPLQFTDITILDPRVRLWPVALLQVELTSAERLGRGKNLQGPRFGGSKQITVRSWGTMAKGRPASPSDFFSSDAFVGSRGLKTGISILCRLQQTTLVIRPRDRGYCFRTLIFSFLLPALPVIGPRLALHPLCRNPSTTLTTLIARSANHFRIVGRSSDNILLI
ncbi:hypothetical protein NXS19_004150 [Fusarium pseudograminearum]|nr:hypothetical protein NXS19_004150 [Fusarium pseudograminearum]